MFVGQNIVGAVGRRRPIDWEWHVFHEILYWAVWGALLPAIFRVARTHRLGIGRAKAWLAHVAAALAVAAAQPVGTLLLQGVLLGLLGFPVPGGLWRWMRGNTLLIVLLGLTALWKYWVIVGLWYGFDFYRKYVQSERRAAEQGVRAAQLETSLATARLDALQMQLHPHFLFNTLNAVAVLIRDSPQSARRMVVRLSELLRLTLERSGVQEVPLRRELEFIERYADILRIRFEDRFRLDTEVDPELLDALVPSLVLQPLVENAFEHGVGARAAGGSVLVRAAREGDRVILEVIDDGPGASVPRPRAPDGTAGAPAPYARTGIGLANTRARVEQLYGARHRFETYRPPGGGFAVRIDLPLRIQPVEGG